MSPREIIEEQIPVALKKRPELAAAINALIHWQITGPQGGNWTMDLSRQTDWIIQGLEGAAAMVITIGDEDFVRLRSGELNGTLALMSGKLQFRPLNIPLAMKIAELLG